MNQVLQILMYCGRSVFFFKWNDIPAAIEIGCELKSRFPDRDHCRGISEANKQLVTLSEARKHHDQLWGRSLLKS